MNLPELQRLFEAAVMGDVAPGGPGEPKATTMVTGNDRLDAAAQLGIYREQFWLRHVQSLKDDFGTLFGVLGDAGFEDLVRAYLRAHPPSNYSLRDLGKDLPVFVERQEPWCNDPLLHDCARLEWAFIEAYDAVDLAPLDPTTIDGVPEEAWDGARILLDSSLRVLELGHPVHQLRQDLRDGRPPQRPDRNAVTVAVYRQNHRLGYLDLEPLAGAVLLGILAGMPLGAACEAAVNRLGFRESDVESRLSQWFLDWTQRGFIRRITF